MLVDLSLYIGICTLTGTLFKGMQTRTVENYWPKQSLTLEWLCNSSLSASSLYHKLFCINLERFLTGVGGISFILLTVLSGCCL